METMKRSTFSQCEEGGEINRQSRVFLSSENTLIVKLCIYFIIHLSKIVEYIKPKVNNPKIKYRLWAILLY